MEFAYAATFESLGLGKLNRDEKIALAGELRDDLGNPVEPARILGDAHLAELSRRLTEAAKGNVAWIPLETSGRKSNAAMGLGQAREIISRSKSRVSQFDRMVRESAERAPEPILERVFQSSRHLPPSPLRCSVVVPGIFQAAGGMEAVWDFNLGRSAGGGRRC